MKIVIASDSYKGTVPSWRIGEIVADAAKCALKEQYAKGELEIAVIPISDGGEGALEAIGCQVKMARVKNPDGEMIDARYGISGKIAFIESANANGYALTKLKNPEKYIHDEKLLVNFKKLTDKNPNEGEIRIMTNNFTSEQDKVIELMQRYLKESQGFTGEDTL
jgi:hypothetical protein